MLRRQVLAGLASLAAMVAAPPRLAVAERQSDIEALRALFRNPESLRRVGEACARAGWTPPDVPDFCRALHRSLGARHGGSMKRKLAAHIRADFTARRLARVEGWVLSETEARLYAGLRADIAS